MKKEMLMAIIACLMTLGVQAQENNESNASQVYDVVENMPQYPGGMPALIQFLSENISYPKDAKEKSISGRVLVTFIVEKDGSVSEVQSATSTYPSLDDEAVRVVKAMPHWKPGTLKGDSVRVRYTIPINFNLD